MGVVVAAAAAFALRSVVTADANDVDVAVAVDVFPSFPTFGFSGIFGLSLRPSWGREKKKSLHHSWIGSGSRAFKYSRVLREGDRGQLRSKVRWVGGRGGRSCGGESREIGDDDAAAASALGSAATADANDVDVAVSDFSSFPTFESSGFSGLSLGSPRGREKTFWYHSEVGSGSRAIRCSREVRNGSQLRSKVRWVSGRDG